MGRCPACRYCAAVNKRAAHTVYHSAHYAKLREGGTPVLGHRGPQVGRIRTIEELMCDHEFIDRVKPAKKTSPSTNRNNRPPWEGFAWIVGLLIFVLLCLGTEVWPIKILAWLMCGVLLWITIMLDQVSLNKPIGRLGEYERSWICVKCGHEWIANSNR